MYMYIHNQALIHVPFLWILLRQLKQAVAQTDKELCVVVLGTKDKSPVVGQLM